MNTGVGATAAADSSPPSPLSHFLHSLSRRYRHLLDKSAPLVLRRWILLSLLAASYAVRVYVVQGFYVVTYALGIYLIQLLILFLSPQVDPDSTKHGDGPTLLPTRGSDEFRPFVRRLPEFKFWYTLVKAFSVAFMLTFFSVFDMPVFWPILLFYWAVLFISMMKKQIRHMVKHKYVPLSIGKKRYTGKRTASSDDAKLPPA